MDEEDTEQHRDWAPVPDVYALGDCCADLERPLPPLAQVRAGGRGGEGQGRQRGGMGHRHAAWQGLHGRGCTTCGLLSSLPPSPPGGGAAGQVLGTGAQCGGGQAGCGGGAAAVLVQALGQHGQHRCVGGGWAGYGGVRPDVCSWRNLSPRSAAHQPQPHQPQPPPPHHCACNPTGGKSAVIELGDNASRPFFSWGGFSSWVAWRRCMAAGGADLPAVKPCACRRERCCRLPAHAP